MDSIRTLAQICRYYKAPPLHKLLSSSCPRIISATKLRDVQAILLLYSWPSPPFSSWRDSSTKLTRMCIWLQCDEERSPTTLVQIPKTSLDVTSFIFFGSCSPSFLRPGSFFFCCVTFTSHCTSSSAPAVPHFSPRISFLFCLSPLSRPHFSLAPNPTKTRILDQISSLEAHSTTSSDSGHSVASVRKPSAANPSRKQRARGSETRSSAHVLSSSSSSSRTLSRAQIT